MDDNTQKDMIANGLKFLDEALYSFMQIKGCDNSPEIVKILYGVIFMIEKLYGIKK